MIMQELCMKMIKSFIEKNALLRYDKGREVQIVVIQEYSGRNFFLPLYSRLCDCRRVFSLGMPCGDIVYCGRNVMCIRSGIVEKHSFLSRHPDKFGRIFRNCASGAENRPPDIDKTFTMCYNNGNEMNKGVHSDTRDSCL